MADYNYGESPVHGFATPDDGTPLDAVSWAHLVDGIGVGVPFVVASQIEQDEYQAALTAAGLGPSSSRIARVVRTDLAGLVLRNDGTGWKRDLGGSLNLNGYASASVTDTAGTVATRGSVAVTLPAAADLFAMGTVTAIPPETGSWRFYLWLEDDTGRELSPRIDYGGLPRVPYAASVQSVFDMPAGSGQVRLRTRVHPDSAPVTWSHVQISGHYA